MKLIILTILSFLFTVSAQAQFNHDRIKRITVFPLKIEKSESKELEKPAEDAWWALREQLTESKRFLVASKNFMQAKDVFQQRGELQPSDVLILGRLLDANAIITVFLIDKKISMRVYEAKNGMTIWAGDIELHPAIPVSKQLDDAAQKLLMDFITSIPYQGHVILDQLIGTATYEEKGKKLFKVDVGAGTQVTVGDTVQLIRVKVERLNPTFQNGADIEVYAEGKVVQVDRNILTVQLIRSVENEDVRVEALVRIPDELRRLREIYGMYDDPNKNLDYGAVEHMDEFRKQKQDETKPLVTSLSWIGNLVAILLLAF